MGGMVVSEPPQFYTSLASRFASLSTTPFTPEHAMWTLAADNRVQALPVQWGAWIGAPVLTNP